MPRIHWDVLREMVELSSVPLVLHGASGLSWEDLARAVGLGIGKINFNTELRTGVFWALGNNSAPLRADKENLAEVIDRWSQAAGEFARTTLGSLAGRAA